MIGVDPPTTSPTLLRRLALPEGNEAWEVFVEHYGPFIRERCLRAGLQPADADDTRAEVCARLVEAMRGFRYDPARSFRGYLRRVVDNAIRSHWRTIRRRPGWVGRGDVAGDDPPEPLASLGAELDGRIRSQVEVMLHLVDDVRREFAEESWRAFELTALEGLSGAEAAAKLDKSVAAVFMAKSRVLARLRERVAEFQAD